MLKRKLMMPLLALMLSLVLLPASAVQIPPELMAMFGGEQEPAEMVVVEDNFIVYDGLLGKSAYYIAMLENKSDGLATINTGTLQLLDAAGNELGNQNMFGSVPLYMQPGEVSYITQDYFNLPAEAYDQIDSWKLTVEGVAIDAPGQEPVPLDITVEMSEGVEYSFMSGDQQIKQLKFVATVTNNGTETAFDPMALLILRDPNGKVIASANLMGASVGIPAGGTVYLTGSLSTGLPGALESNGQTAATVEGIAYHLPARAQ